MQLPECKPECSASPMHHDTCVPHGEIPVPVQSDGTPALALKAAARLLFSTAATIDTMKPALAPLEGR